LNDLDTDIGTYCYSMIQNSCEFDEAWYDWDIKELRKFIKENSRNRFVFVQYTYEQLGNDAEWFEEQCAQLNNDLLKIKRELLLEWTLANDTSPFSEEQLEGIGEHAKDPIGKFYVMKKYKFDIYSDMRNILKKSWMIGIDVGGGLRRDYTAITITDPKDMVVKAEFKSNGISVPDLSDLLIELVMTMMPGAVLIPERNTLGIALIQLLMKSPVADNLYYEVREKEGEKTVGDPKAKTARKTKSQTRVYGIHTGSNSARNGTRDIMINEILNNAVNETPFVFTSKNMYAEIRTLERDKKGKVEHRQGCHDDLLFSWLVACYAFLYGKSSGKFFKVLSDGAEEAANESGAKRTVQNIARMTQLNSTDRPETLSENIIDRYRNGEMGGATAELPGEESGMARKKKRARSLSFISQMNK
jgi:hypothetical protein